MRNRRLSGQVGFLLGVAALVAWFSTPRFSEASGLRQAEALADLAAGITQCSTHPCLGDCAMKVRGTLQGRLVNDGYFDYSDLEISYPEVRGTLRGVVEWNLEGTLDDVSLIVGDFQSDPAVLRMELERALPGCKFESDTTDDEEITVEQMTEDLTTIWECSVRPEGREELSISIHVAPEMVILAIES